MVAKRLAALVVAVGVVGGCGPGDPQAEFDSDYCQQRRWDVSQKIAEVNDILAAIRASTMTSAQTKEAFARGDQLMLDANRAVVATPTCFVAEEVSAAEARLAEQ